MASWSDCPEWVDSRVHLTCYKRYHSILAMDTPGDWSTCDYHHHHIHANTRTYWRAQTSKESQGGEWGMGRGSIWSHGD